MQLSPHFSLAELTRTSTGLPNDPPAEGVAALAHGAVTVLQPLRDRLGRLRVTSGYRSAEVNEAVGGAPTSRHCTGEAADIEALDAAPEALWASVRDLAYAGTIDQAILYEDGTHIHVGWRLQGQPRGELLVRQADGRTVHWASYRGPFKAIVAPSAVEAPAVVPRQPPPDPTDQEAPMAIEPRAYDVLKDKLAEEGTQALEALNDAVKDGVIDENDEREFRGHVLGSFVEVLATVLDVITVLPDPLESITDAALQALVNGARAKGPDTVRKAERWFTAIRTRAPRKLVALIAEIEEADRDDGVRGNLQQRAMYVAAKRLIQLRPAVAAAHEIAFDSGGVLLLDGQPYGEPPRRFRPPEPT